MDLEALRLDPGSIPHLSLTSHEQLILATSPAKQVRRNLARSKDLAPQVLLLLAGDNDIAVQETIAGEHPLPLGVQHHLALTSQRRVKQALALSDHVNDAVLALLAGDVDPHVRTSVASNPSLPGEVTWSLALDESILVQKALTSNPGIDWTQDVPAASVRTLKPTVYEDHTREVDPETLRSFQDHWEGSLRDLVEAARLVVA